MAKEQRDDAARLLGLLAEPVRMRVAAAIVLGADTLDEVVRRTDLPADQVEKALVRLVTGGLVEQFEGQGLRFTVERLKAAARLAAPEKKYDEFDAPPEKAKILRAFLSGGRLKSIPMSHGKRLIVLDYIAQEFEPGRRYTERQVNEVLKRFHSDYATLRRYMSDAGLLEREAGRYWRGGGTYEVD